MGLGELEVWRPRDLGVVRIHQGRDPVHHLEPQAGRTTVNLNPDTVISNGYFKRQNLILLQEGISHERQMARFQRKLSQPFDFDNTVIGKYSTYFT
jgi:hypothetical protein